MFGRSRSCLRCILILIKVSSCKILINNIIKKDSNRNLRSARCLLIRNKVFTLVQRYRTYDLDSWDDISKPIFAKGDRLVFWDTDLPLTARI